MIIRCFILLAALALSARETAGADAFIIQEGKPVGRILLPADPGPEIKLAAAELREHLQLMSGVALEVADDPGGAPPAGSIRLALAEDAATATYRDGGDQSFIIDQRDGRVLIEGKSALAVLFGVYEYLQELGVRWFVPGDIGTHVPRRDSVAANGTRQAVRPGFRVRSIGLNGNVDWHWDKAKLDENQPAYAYWMLRNRLHGASKRTEPYLPGISNIVREATGHNIRIIYKWRKLTLEKNPERFPLVTGKEGKVRTNKGQICFTHPDNIADAVAWCVDFFEKNPGMATASMSLSDHAGICECEACTRANGGVDPAVAGDRLVWGFMNEVARQVGGRMPGKGIAFYSGYGATTQPPEGLKAESNIVGVVAHVDHNNRDLDDPECLFNVDHLKKFAALKATGAEMFARDYTTYPASLQPLALVKYVKTYHELGCVGYTCEVMARSDHHMMVNWAQAQLAWNPELDPRRLIEEFCLTFYGAAGPDVLAVVDVIEAAARGVPKITLGGFGSAQEILTDARIASIRSRLEAASAKVDGVYAERLVRFRETFELYSRMAEAYRALFTALDDRTPERQAAAVAKFDAALAYWQAHDMGRICSPIIVPGWIERVRQTAIDLPSVNPGPQAAPEADDADARLRELFSMAPVPERIEGLTWLPPAWKFRIDIDGTGETNGWMRSDYDDSRWASLGYGAFDDQGFRRFEGTFWYRTAFDAPRVQPGNRIKMRIGALDDDGRIFVNGRLAHTRIHLDGGDWKRSFAFDVTDFVKPGPANVVAICGRNDYGKGGLLKPVAIYLESIHPVRPADTP